MVDNTYDYNDIDEYLQWFDDNNLFIDKNHLINSINYFCNENNVCDFYFCMNYLFNKSMNSYNHCINYLQQRSGYYTAIYMYFKFLLLECNKKIYYETLFDKIYSINVIIYDKYNENNIYEFLDIVYDIINDDSINIFIDTKDIHNEYEKLDIQNCKNMHYNLEHYGTDIFIKRFVHTINTYHRIKYFHNLIYFFSNSPTYQSMTNENEIINGKEDFKRRFDKNIDKLLDIWYLFLIYRDVYNITNEEIYNILINDNNKEYYTKKEFINIDKKLLFIKQNIIYTIILGYSKNITFQIFENDYEKQNLNDIYIYYLNKHYHYNQLYTNDEYKVLKYIKYHLDENNILKIRYCNNIQRNITYINYISYIIDILNKNDNKNELYDFLLKIQNIYDTGMFKLYYDIHLNE